MRNKPEVNKTIEEQYREVEQKVSPEKLKYMKALAEQRGDKNLLESIKSFENWKQSMDITRSLLEKRPMLKIIEGGKE